MPPFYACLSYKVRAKDDVIKRSSGQKLTQSAVIYDGRGTKGDGGGGGNVNYLVLFLPILLTKFDHMFLTLLKKILDLIEEERSRVQGKVPCLAFFGSEAPHETL